MVASEANLTDLAKRREAPNPGDQKGAEPPFLAAPRPKGGVAASYIIRQSQSDKTVFALERSPPLSFRIAMRTRATMLRGDLRRASGTAALARTSPTRRTRPQLTFRRISSARWRYRDNLGQSFFRDLRRGSMETYSNLLERGFCTAKYSCVRL